MYRYNRHMAAAVLLLWFAQPSYCPADNERPGIRSEPVSLGSGDYTLLVQTGNRLYLEHKAPNGELRQWPVAPVVLDSRDSPKEREWPFERNAANITTADIALARWSKNSLVAVVKIVEMKDAAFWCLTFPHAELGSTRSEALMPGAVLLMKGASKDRILALNGSRSATSITVVVGKLSALGNVDTGMIVAHGCPNPGPIGAHVGRFNVDYSQENKGK